MDWEMNFSPEFWSPIFIPRQSLFGETNRVPLNTLCWLWKTKVYLI